MTLQQKMLAKQSKKGFTLVELVVVIAILAILAAIAIPAVVGIINNANESAGQSDAATVNNACKTFYAGIKSGTINTDSTNPDGSKVTAAAAPGESDAKKLAAAKKATVADAQKYSGINVSCDNLAYYATNAAASAAGKTIGDIIYFSGDSSAKPANATQLASNTTFAALYALK
ncbi:MAG: prepilin-type N-terminal cleavage/methylation domain-containing protein [Acutalibacteraceae bacterium]